MDTSTEGMLRSWAETYNDMQYFREDPLSFPAYYAGGLSSGQYTLKDVEVAAVFAAHLAWGRRAMIVRDCTRLFDEMGRRPYDYVMKGEWKDDPVSLHRTVKWSEAAGICARLKSLYEGMDSLESLSQDDFRVKVYGAKSDPSAPNKKINLLRRWMVRRDGKVDLGIWRNTDPKDLIIPLDTHVHAQATALGITGRKAKDLRTALEITSFFEDLFPGDPCLGDYALFGYGVTHPK